jgi:hypothetical protein
MTGSTGLGSPVIYFGGNVPDEKQPSGMLLNFCLSSRFLAPHGVALDLSVLQFCGASATGACMDSVVVAIFCVLGLNKKMSHGER